MIRSNSLLKAALVAAVGFVPVACAQQGSQPAVQGMNSSAQSMPGMSGMSGMQGHNMPGHTMMQGQDMQTMMAQCSDMRRQMAQGTHPNTPGMAQMMAHCDEMDRSMGSIPGMGSGSTAAPAATRSR
jgi:hypothetical protein